MWGMSFVYEFIDQQVQIIYVDYEVLVVVKFLGLLLVLGCGDDRSDCLINWLCGVFFIILLVYWLDMDILGVMVFGLMFYVQWYLFKQFEEWCIKKIYVVWFWGQMVQKFGMVDLFLIVDWLNCLCQKVDYEIGKFVCIDWWVICSDLVEICVCLLLVMGCSYQLWVYMVLLGYLILGDLFYVEGVVVDFLCLMLYVEMLCFKYFEIGIM